MATDRVFSARLDRQVVDELMRATRRLGITKKRFVEEAIRLRIAQSAEGQEDVWEETRGTWKRRESPGATVRRSRRAFEAAMARHHRARKRS